MLVTDEFVALATIQANELFSQEEIFFDGGTWPSHTHLGLRNSGLWGHYLYPVEDGALLTVYFDKLAKGFAGMDACKSEGRGEEVTIFLPTSVAPRFIDFYTNKEVEKEIVYDYYEEDLGISLWRESDYEEWESLENKLLVA